MREFTVPPAVTIKDTTTLVQAVWTNAEARPDAAQFARRTDAGWEDITCARFRDDVVALARGLVAAGVAPGDRVGLISRTRYEWTLIDYAIWACGAVTVPIYETSSPDQIQWILSDSAAVACFVETADHAANLGRVRDDLPDLRHTWEIEAGGLTELIAAGGPVDPAEVDRRRLAGRADDLATIIYTSGTTGRPKGCVLTHRNIYADIANTIPHLPNLFQPGAATLLFLPLAHSFARIIQVGVVEAQVHTAYTADPRNLLADLGSFKPTFVLAVPRVFEKVFNGARQKAVDGGNGALFDRATAVAVAYSEALDAGGPNLVLRLRHMLFDLLVYRKLRAAMGGRCQAAISGGAPLGARLAHFFRGIGVTIYEGYGLTETSPAVAVNLEDHIRIGTVGRPLPGVTVRIDDDGEILIKGDIVFKGYFNAPAATAEVLDADGWFHTGDLGALDDDGYLSITGRKKEIIVTAGGKNVAPAVLEDRIRAHPLISQCMVVGDRQPFVAALVTIDEESFPAWCNANGKPADARPGDLRDDEDLRREVQTAVDEANRAVSKAESIRVFRILSEDFTEGNGLLTPSLKVKRTIVAKEYADEIAAIYS
ncbi:long-chain fatty acid--CoA ligase [Luedemannella flava]|uniref:Long-chain fatty acid--CoA ligase n=1 Tax=Luedemannella flava TaxID=349316 RepID=A0ABP4Y504_9ACTN